MVERSGVEPPVGATTPTGAGPPSLAGFTVGVTADHRREEQIEALGRRGARVVRGPVVRPVPLAAVEALEAAIEEVLADPPEAVVLTTPLGAEGWLSAAEGLGRDRALLDILGQARVLAWGVDGGPATAAGPGPGVGVERELAAGDLQATLAAVAPGRMSGAVAVQSDGSRPAAALVVALRAAGARVVVVPVTPTELPEDPQPALELVSAVVDGGVDAVTFTSAAEVRNLMALAAEAGWAEEVRGALSGEVVPACLGCSGAGAASSLGMAGVVVPDRARIGAMVEALATRLATTAVRLRLEGVEVVVRGALAVVDGEEVWLAERERALLAVLSRRPGAVVAKDELLRQVWRSDGADGPDAHAVEVAVARLRRRLGAAGPAIRSVARRGYRLVPG